MHRMSQRSATTVHRFVVRGTVEVAIMKLRADGADNADDTDGATPSPSKRAKPADETRALTWSQLRRLFDLRADGGDDADGGADDDATRSSS